MTRRFMTKGKGPGRKVIPLRAKPKVRQASKVRPNYKELSVAEFIKSPYHKVGAEFKLTDPDGKVYIGHIYNKYVMKNIIIYYFRITQPWYRWGSTRRFTHFKGLKN